MFKTRIKAVCSFFFLFVQLMDCSQKTDSMYKTHLTFCEQQIQKSIENLTDISRFPRSTDKNGSWRTFPASDWTSGFFPASIWYMYEYTKEPQWKLWAQKWTAGLEQQKLNTTTHDLGFMIFCPFGNGYRLTKADNYKQVLLKAAESLASRFNTKVGCIKSWDWMEEFKFPVIIDNMMNLELLFWASKNRGHKEYYDIAVQHALTTINNHIREDGSTFHVVQYDENTGEIKKKHTHQGYSDESCWARGQAWGLYGFTMTYRETNDKRFLETAIKLAEYFVNNLPQDYVPYWDFNAPDIPDEPRDTSAGAIAASGLLELSQLCQNIALKNKYQQTASKILENLSSSKYLSKGTNSSAILLHGVGSKPGNSEIDVSLIYGDYYFVEALLRAQKMVN